MISECPSAPEILSPYHVGTYIFIGIQKGKPEARNPKFETISNVQIPNVQNKGEFKKFGF
jgi:hypothetical protein